MTYKNGHVFTLGKYDTEEKANKEYRHLIAAIGGVNIYKVD